MATQSERSFRGRTLLDCSWIIDRKFQQLNQGLDKRLHAFNSPASSFPKPEGVDGDMWQPSLKVYHKGKAVGSQSPNLNLALFG